MNGRVAVKAESSLYQMIVFHSTNDFVVRVNTNLDKNYAISTLKRSTCFTIMKMSYKHIFMT